jgi:hypothetical protein
MTSFYITSYYKLGRIGGVRIRTGRKKVKFIKFNPLTFYSSEQENGRHYSFPEAENLRTPREIPAAQWYRNFIATTVIIH